MFDEPSVDGRPAERREDYELFPDFFNELPLRVDHHLIVTSSGAYNAGKVSRFAIVDGQRIVEGTQLGGAVVTQIRRDGVELDVNGRRVLLPRP